MTDFGPKSAQKLSFWSRPTIPWKLECESTPKLQVMSQIVTVDEAINGYDLVIYKTELKTILWCGIILLVLEVGFIACMCLMLKGEGQPEQVITVTNTGCCCRCFFFLPILIQAWRIGTQVDDVELVIKNAADLINGCSDE